MTNNVILERLFTLQDTKYRDFQARLIPTVADETIIGVRTPQLRLLAKKIMKSGQYNDFLSVLPHKYFDENQLHAFIISQLKDFEECINALNDFLPYVDNWATCDQMSPVVFKKNKQLLMPYIDEWIASGQTYKIRFAVCQLMMHFLDKDFKTVYANKVSLISSNEYYVNMMCAWYFSTALAKQYECIIPFFKNRLLSKEVHNKAIQKAVESFRIPRDTKDYLKTLKIK